MYTVDIKLRKCTGTCKGAYTEDNFRKGHTKCKACERDRQNEIRRLKVLSTGMRKDPTRAITDVEREAMVTLASCGWSQAKIGLAMNLVQSTVAKNITKYNESNAPTL